MSENSRCKITIGDLSNTNNVKESRNKPKQSAWFLTVNSNMLFEDDDKSIGEFAKHFRDTLETMCKNKEIMLNMITVRGKGNPLDFDQVITEFQLEKAPQSKRLHAHGIIVLIHKSNLHLSSRKMQSWLKADMKERLKGSSFKPPKNFYVHFDFISADDWGSKEYEKQKMMDFLFLLQ